MSFSEEKLNGRRPSRGRRVQSGRKRPKTTILRTPADDGRGFFPRLTEVPPRDFAPFRTSVEPGRPVGRAGRARRPPASYKKSTPPSVRRSYYPPPDRMWEKERNSLNFCQETNLLETNRLESLAARPRGRDLRVRAEEPSRTCQNTNFNFPADDGFPADSQTGPPLWPASPKFSRRGKFYEKPTLVPSDIKASPTVGRDWPTGLFFPSAPPAGRPADSGGGCYFRSSSSSIFSRSSDFSRSANYFSSANFSCFFHSLFSILFFPMPAAPILSGARPHAPTTPSPTTPGPTPVP